MNMNWNMQGFVQMVNYGIAMKKIGDLQACGAIEKEFTEFKTLECWNNPKENNVCVFNNRLMLYKEEQWRDLEKEVEGN